jgi:quinolinate synthase
MTEQTPLGAEYLDLDKDTLLARIAARKAELGNRLCILGHHYQRDDIVAFADHTGDSLKLSQLAANETDAEFIVFCGVHFMAESADVLSSDKQVVCLPNLDAGCAMADMADASAVRAAMDELGALTTGKIIPISYVNSSAAIKAVTGAGGGSCCTSSNVRRVFDWAFAPDGGGADKILALPDEHLARNTAAAMGFADDADCVIYDPALPDGGLNAEQVDRARFILWKGFCHVHQIFTVDDIERVRRESPRARIIVHPECPRPVVAAADENGSTAQIITAIDESPMGTHWVVGTEGHLVARLAHRYPDKRIELLSAPTPAPCWQMGKVDLPHLLWVLDHLATGDVVNRVSVPADIAADARVALQQMINIPG